MAGMGAMSELKRTGLNGCDKSFEFGDKSSSRLAVSQKMPALFRSQAGYRLTNCCPERLVTDG